MTLTWAPLGAVAALLVVVAIGLASERRATQRRRAIGRLYQFGEQLVSNRSFAESLRLLESVLPALLGVTEVRVYLQDRASRTLKRLEAANASGPAPMPVLTEEHVRFREGSVDLCFRNRSLIATPDTRRSPLFDKSQAAETPRSMALAPMFAQEDLLGVLAVGHAGKVRRFTEDERAVLQHLANQVAIGVKLLEQASLSGRAVEGERLDAHCRLVATALGELQQPLGAIARLSRSLAGRCAEEACRSESRLIAGQAGLASGMMSWLLRFAGLHREQEQSLDLAAVLRGMLSRRQEDWQKRGLHVRTLVSADPIFVAAPAGIVEQLFSSILWHAEDRLAQPGEGSLTLRAFRLASTAQVDVSWPAPLSDLEQSDLWNDGGPAGEDVLSLAICRDLVRTQGGQMSLARASDGSTRLEVELPLTQPGPLDIAELPRSAKPPAAPLTALVLEPDPAARQVLLSVLSDLGHRVVPVSSAEEAADLARRMVFHVIFCSASPAGATWFECLQATRDRVRTFVLLTRVHDPSLAAALPTGGGCVLVMPPRPEELDRILQEAEARRDSSGR